MIRLLAAGVGLTAVVTGALVLAWGSAALVPGVAFGLLATAIQLAAVAVLRPVLAQPFPRVMARWGIGMALRLGGVVLFAVAALVNRELFPPLPAALAYLGVLLPLLFTEMRFAR
jgi:hypothetical protein